MTELFDSKEAQFIALIAEGKTWNQCAAIMGCAESTFSRWLAKADADELRKQYAHAREAQGDAYADRVIDVAEDVTLDAAEKRVRMDAYKWAAGKRKPKVYGDKIDHNHGSDPSTPVRLRITWDDGAADNDPVSS